MGKLAVRLAVVVSAAAALIYSCSENAESPVRPELAQSTRRAAQADCGEVAYLSALSPVLGVWEDSLEAELGDGLLDTPPAWTDQSTVGGHLSTLVPVLQQWEGAINTALGSAVLDSIADFDSGTRHQDYLIVLSSTLVGWKTDLEANRGRTFLPAPPVFQPDETAPEMVCFADTVITCASPDGVVLEFDVTAIDDCDPAPVVTCDPPSGSTFPVGDTEVTCSAADSSGNTSTCTFTVTVEEAEPPVITDATATPGVLWPPNHKWVDVSIRTHVESECDAEVSCTIVDVTSNESDNGTGDGNTSPDWLISGDDTVRLRAERSGNGSGRVYTVRFVCEDDFGNVAEGTVNVVVPHDRGHGGGKK